MRIIPLLIGAVLFSSCKMTNSENKELTPEMISQKTTIEFEEDHFDFGVMTQGEKVDFVYKFKNSGDHPLLILSVQASCGCTVTDGWPDYPIPPGEGGQIPVQFNSEGKKGHQSKSISLIANTEPRTTVLMIEGEVIAPN